MELEKMVDIINQLFDYKTLVFKAFVLQDRSFKRQINMIDDNIDSILNNIIKTGNYPVFEEYEAGGYKKLIKFVNYPQRYSKLGWLYLNSVNPDYLDRKELEVMKLSGIRRNTKEEIYSTLEITNSRELLGKFIYINGPTIDDFITTAFRDVEPYTLEYPSESIIDFEERNFVGIIVRDFHNGLVAVRCKTPYRFYKGYEDYIIDLTEFMDHVYDERYVKYENTSDRSRFKYLKDSYKTDFSPLAISNKGKFENYLRNFFLRSHNEEVNSIKKTYSKIINFS